MSKPLDLENRLIDFAVRVINVVEALPTSLHFADHKSPIVNRYSKNRRVGPHHLRVHWNLFMLLLPGSLFLSRP